MTTKKDIIKDIAERTGLTQVETRQVVQQVFECILDTLARDQRIELRNFGVFQVRERPARKARNPRTGEEVMVPSRKVVVFKPGLRMEHLFRQ